MSPVFDFSVHTNLLSSLSGCFQLEFLKFDNWLLRSFHTFCCKQTVSNMLTDSSAFATLRDTHGGDSVKNAVHASVAAGSHRGSPRRRVPMEEDSTYYYLIPMMMKDQQLSASN